jgi:hypothetical protein
VEEGRERVAQCQGMTPATPHSTRTALVMAAQRWAICTTPGSDSQAASEGRCGGDSLFDTSTRDMSGHLMLRSGEQVRCRGPRGSLERGGDALEGLKPSSEAEICSRGPVPSCGAGICRVASPPPPTPAWQRSLALIRIDQGLFGKALGVNSPLIPAEALSKIFKEK